jgi:hypothetical protein
MKEIKFRQAIFKDGKFHHWHYWGFVGHRGAFVAPIEINQNSYQQTYKIKDSQLYSGRRSGKLQLGKEIYEGDLMTSPSIKQEYLPCLVKFGEHADIAEAGCTSHTNIGFYIQDAAGQQTGFLNEELLMDWDSFEIIGSNHENPELLATGMA